MLLSLVNLSHEPKIMLLDIISKTLFNHVNKNSLSSNTLLATALLMFTCDIKRLAITCIPKKLYAINTKAVFLKMFIELFLKVIKDESL